MPLLTNSEDVEEAELRCDCYCEALKLMVDRDPGPMLFVYAMRNEARRTWRGRLKLAWQALWGKEFWPEEMVLYLKTVRQLRDWLSAALDLAEAQERKD